jgi:cytosine/adenosine deaminase-related metal-dependent hydrolase
MKKAPKAVSETATLVKILAGRLFDSISGQFLEEQLITVCPSRGIILDIRPCSLNEAVDILREGEDVVDLRGQTVLPGFVDTHVHCEPTLLRWISLPEASDPGFIKLIF